MGRGRGVQGVEQEDALGEAVPKGFHHRRIRLENEFGGHRAE
jgi:hypothetical protein